ncbi:TPA: Origin recognition complex, subunit 1, variant 3 [Trebouxia sp. C0005]
MQLDLNLLLGMCPKDHVPAAQKRRFEPQAPNKRRKTATGADERRQPMKDITNTVAHTPALSDIQPVSLATQEKATQRLAEDADATVEGNTFEESSMEPDAPHLILTLGSDDEPDPCLDARLGSGLYPPETRAAAHASDSCLNTQSRCHLGSHVPQSNKAFKTVLQPGQEVATGPAVSMSTYVPMGAAADPSAKSKADSVQHQSKAAGGSAILPVGTSPTVLQAPLHHSWGLGDGGKEACVHEALPDHNLQAPQLIRFAAHEQNVTPALPTLAAPSASKDPLLAKSRVASFYGKKKPPANVLPAIKAPGCQPLRSALPQLSVLSNRSVQPVASQQHDKPIHQVTDAAASSLPESADSADQLIANFVSHLAGSLPATQDAAVKPHEMLAAKAEAERNAQDAAAFEALDDGNPSDGKVRGRKKQFALLSSTLQHLVEQGTAGTVVLSGPPGGGKTLTALAVLHTLGNLPDAESFSKRRPAFIYLPFTDTAASAWCPRILHAIKTFPKDQGQQVYRPEYRDPKKRIDRARNHASLQEEVTKRWVPEKGLGPGMFVVIMDHMEKLSTRLDDAKKQIQDLFATTKVKASRLILVVITNCGEPDLHKLGLDEHDILRFPAYTAKEMKNVFRRRMRKLEGVQVFDPEALQAAVPQERALQGRISVAFDICKNALRMERQARQNVSAEAAIVSEARSGKRAATKDGLQDQGDGIAKHSYLIGLPMMRKAVLEATPVQTTEEITTDFQLRLLAKQQRVAAEESLGNGKDPVKLRALKEEVLCPAPQSSGFDIEAMSGDAKHKVQCIRRLPRDSMAVLCGAIVLMRVDLRLQVPACHAI